MNINFKEIIKRNNPIILDIGTHNGEHSIMFSDLFPEGKIFAFEADPDVWPLFESKVGNIQNIELVKNAVGNKNGELVFYNSYFENNIPGASGTFQKPTSHLSLHPQVKYGETKVNCITLDSWFNQQNIDMIDFAWTDVNGAEVALVEGGINTFNKHTRYLQLECIPYELWENQSTQNVLVEMLSECFDLIDQDNINLLFKNKNI
jgi:FkbM family methyltransferase